MNNNDLTAFLSNIPAQKVVKLSDMERFFIGLKLLLKECNLTKYTYNAFGLSSFTFADGSHCSAVRAAIEAGFIDKDEYMKHYLDE